MKSTVESRVAKYGDEALTPSSGKSRSKRLDSDEPFQWACKIALTLPLILLGCVIGDAIIEGFPRLNLDFLQGYASRKPELAGFFPAIMGSFYLMVLTAVIAVPLGIGAAIYLQEYAGKNQLASWIEINIANLAGVPSIIYGLLGLQVFVRTFGFDRSLLAGASTLALLILPMIIVASREALRTVPESVKEGAYALGATRWRAITTVMLPIALPGMLTGIILSCARAIGETAPLITIGALAYISFVPDSAFSPFTAMPIQIFNWLSRPQPGFHTNAAAGITVLLALTFILNAFAIYLRARLQKRLR